MNRWYVAALLAVGVTFALMQALPEDCPQGQVGCDGIMIAPIVVLFIGCVGAAVLGIIGFVRSTR